MYALLTSPWVVHVPARPCTRDHFRVCTTLTFPLYVTLCMTSSFIKARTKYMTVHKETSLSKSTQVALRKYLPVLHREELCLKVM